MIDEVPLDRAWLLERCGPGGRPPGGSRRPGRPMRAWSGQAAHGPPRHGSGSGAGWHPVHPAAEV